MNISRQQFQTILDNAPVGVDKKKLMEKFVMDGHQIEGIDSNVVKQSLQPKPTEAVKPSFIEQQKEILTGKERTERVKGIVERTQKGEQGLGQAAFQVGGEVIRGGFESFAGLPGIKQGFDLIGKGLGALSETEPIKKAGEVISPITGKALDWYNSLDENNKANVDAAIQYLSVIPAEKVGGAVLSKALKVVDEAAPAVKATVDATKSAIKTSKDVIKSGATKVVNTIEDFGRKINAPDVADATKVSLNPKKALMESGQDIQVSVGGKLKKLSEVSPAEYEKMQLSTEKSLTNFTKEAELYKNNRNPLNDPTEIVGQRVDKALEFANKKRQNIGKKMGDIEVKYTNENLPIGKKTNSTFAETIKSFDSKFGMDAADAKVVQKLVNDFDILEKGGATIGERLEFVRSWDKYLNDAKDTFGKFKENATANTRIQNAVKTLKEETVSAISSKDKVYRGLRSQYSIYKKLDEIGDSLLGKDGLLGDRIKGGATVKRALKSNSDAGARQFLTKLKELTGYDAIKEGDIALTAMENVGDYQGLSLLEVLNEGKGGIIKRGLKFVRNKAVGDESVRTLKYIKDKK